MNKSVGILTAGGDSPGLNAAIRSLGKILLKHNYRLVGFRDGFEGIAFDRTMQLTESTLSGILTVGGTILHTSRSKPNRMPVGKTFMDMTDVIVENYHKHHLECLVCIGGGGTHKNAKLLMDAGLKIVTLPKTIDNDLVLTDTSIGFDTALEVVTNALDSLHSTASSHKRVMLVETMGHRAGHLALYGGVAGGADVILLPEIPYDIDKIAAALKKRARDGKRFSIVAVAEGAYPREATEKFATAVRKKELAKDKKEKNEAKEELTALYAEYTDKIMDLAKVIEEKTSFETRITILGHLQRGGPPSSADRNLATLLGAAAAKAILEERYGVMMAFKGLDIVHVPIDEVAGKRKTVAMDDPMLECARTMGITFGD